MPRLIDADALKTLLIDTLESIAKKPAFSDQEVHIVAGCHMLCEMINDAPTIEVEHHGYWGMVKLNHDWMCSCSVCGEIPECFEPSYCPNCGAKMDAKEDDHE